MLPAITVTLMIICIIMNLAFSKLGFNALADASKCFFKGDYVNAEIKFKTIIQNNNTAKKLKIKSREFLTHCYLELKKYDEAFLEIQQLKLLSTDYTYYSLLLKYYKYCSMYKIMLETANSIPESSSKKMLSLKYIYLSFYYYDHGDFSNAVEAYINAAKYTKEKERKGYITSAFYLSKNLNDIDAMQRVAEISGGMKRKFMPDIHFMRELFANAKHDDNIDVFEMSKKIVEYRRSTNRPCLSYMTTADNVNGSCSMVGTLPQKTTAQCAAIPNLSFVIQFNLRDLSKDRNGFLQLYISRDHAGLPSGMLSNKDYAAAHIRDIFDETLCKTIERDNNTSIYKKKLRLKMSDAPIPIPMTRKDFKEQIERVSGVDYATVSKYFNISYFFDYIQGACMLCYPVTDKDDHGLDDITYDCLLYEFIDYGNKYSFLMNYEKFLQNDFTDVKCYKHPILNTL